jgi:hypothetical protein
MAPAMLRELFGHNKKKKGSKQPDRKDVSSINNQRGELEPSTNSGRELSAPKQPSPHSPEGRPNPESVHDESDPSDSWRSAKNAALLALQLTEKALDGLPIPGVKGIVEGIITLIGTLDVCSTEFPPF